MSTDTVVRLTFPAKADYLLLARLALSGVARTTRIDDELLADLKLAVTEACGNAVRHAYPDEVGVVELAFVVGVDQVEMIVEDQGAGMREEPTESEPADALVEGGMGLSIIRAIVDELEVRQGADGRGTVVRMTKRLPAAAS
jgi:serine/threonine-protein kinase RsbW